MHSVQAPPSLPRYSFVSFFFDTALWCPFDRSLDWEFGLRSPKNMASREVSPRPRLRLFVTDVVRLLAIKRMLLYAFLRLVRHGHAWALGRGSSKAATVAAGCCTLSRCASAASALHHQPCCCTHPNPVLSHGLQSIKSCVFTLTKGGGLRLNRSPKAKVDWDLRGVV